MTTLVFGFPGGLYHATPWGHHVNEGLVEWPPSPWRLLRALISVGHTALHWDDGVPATAKSLVEALAGVAPNYTLPAAAIAHSRHYMPIGDKTTLVFDAFARPRNGELSVTWPVRLSAEQRGLLDTLAQHLNYIGRSESWIEGRLVESEDQLPVGERCFLAGAEPPPGKGWERIHLLGTSSAPDFATWQATVSSTAKEVPTDLWGCLIQRTNDLQKAGWNLPPGSRRVLYWRRADALSVAPASVPQRSLPQRVESVLFSLSLPSGNLHALPSVARTLPQAELLHRAAVSLLGKGHSTAQGLELIGRDSEGRPPKGHQHVHILPVDLDDDTHVDHVLFWAPGGFGPDARSALKRLRRTWAKGLPAALQLNIAAIGPVEALTDVTGRWGDGLRRLIGPSKTWRSTTPFLPPRHIKPRGKDTLEGQIRAELKGRGLPEPLSVRVFSRDEALESRFRHFVRERRGDHGNCPGLWFGLELIFEEPVSGPLCVGYFSHFGMGRFGALLDTEGA